MKRKNFLIGIFITQIIVYTLINYSYALDTITHENLNRYIANNTIDGFSLDLYLRDQLGLQSGREEIVNSKEVWWWLKKGGKYEDIPPGSIIPYLRSFHHFHNPLTNEGLKGTWESSIQWSQEPQGTQSPQGHYSWHDVRGYFYDALIATDQTTRDRYFADTFRGLGQLMHLVQDLSVPEHARDDAHILYSYETWVKRNVEYNDIYSYKPFISFNKSVIGNVNSQASVPVANLFDTDQYVASNPDPSLTLKTDIGLSEYTNANFLSPDTMFTSEFPYPKAENCVIILDTPPNGTPDLNRKYLSSTNGHPGEQINHLAVVSYLNYFRKVHFPNISNEQLPVSLDPTCYQDYADKLIPRAVGYSAELLGYFFRGEMQVAAVPVFFDNSIYAIMLNIKNMTPSQEQMANGNFSLIVRYTPTNGNADGSDDIFVRPNDVESGVLQYDEGTDVQFYLPQLIPLENYESVKCMLVFKGEFGNEQNAVIGNSFSLGEIKFNEEWDNGLIGNYQWTHTTPDENPDNGSTSNVTYNSILVKDNIRYFGYDTPRFNSSDLNFVDSNNPDGLLITSDTYIEFKIDDLSINEQPPAPEGTTSAWQFLSLRFNNGLGLQFTQEGQGLYLGPDTAYYTFNLGWIIVVNIYDLFQNYGIPVPEPFYLESIDLTQQFWDLNEPSTVEHQQHTEVDFMRIVERYVTPE